MFSTNNLTSNGPSATIRSGFVGATTGTEMKLVHLVGKAEIDSLVEDEEDRLATEGYPEMMVSYKRVGELLVLLRCSALVDGRINLSVSSWSLHKNNYKEIDVANTQVLVPHEPTAFVIPARRDVNELKVTVLATMREPAESYDGRGIIAMTDLVFLGTHRCQVALLSANEELKSATSGANGAHNGPYAALPPPPPAKGAPTAPTAPKATEKAQSVRQKRSHQCADA